MLRTRSLPESDRRVCDECGRHWWELCDPNGCPDQPYTEVRGSIGPVALRVTLCPLCCADIVEELYPAMGVSISVLRANQQWMIDEGELGITEEPTLVALAGGLLAGAAG